MKRGLAGSVTPHASAFWEPGPHPRVASVIPVDLWGALAWTQAFVLGEVVSQGGCRRLAAPQAVVMCAASRMNLSSVRHCQECPGENGLLLHPGGLPAPTGHVSLPDPDPGPRTQGGEEMQPGPFPSGVRPLLFPGQSSGRQGLEPPTRCSPGSLDWAGPWVREARGEPSARHTCSPRHSCFLPTWHRLWAGPLRIPAPDGWLLAEVQCPDWLQPSTRSVCR